jgi:hypothetical protein
MTSSGWHDHDEWKRKQLEDRANTLDRYIRKYERRIALADSDQDPSGQVLPELNTGDQPKQTINRLKQRLQVLEVQYRDARNRLEIAIPAFEARREQRVRDLFAGPDQPNGFDSDDETLLRGDPNADEPYNPHDQPIGPGDGF